MRRRNRGQRTGATGALVAAFGAALVLLGLRKPDTGETSATISGFNILVQ